MTNRTCPRCKVAKEASEFYDSPQAPYCKDCMKAVSGLKGALITLFRNDARDWDTLRYAGGLMSAIAGGSQGVFLGTRRKVDEARILTDEARLGMEQMRARRADEFKYFEAMDFFLAHAPALKSRQREQLAARLVAALAQDREISAVKIPSEKN